MAHTESFLPVLRLVDQSHHRWVGRGVDASLFVFFRHEIHRRRVRQMLLERIERLIHQRNTIREKENALCPIASHQQIAQGDHLTDRGVVNVESLYTSPYTDVSPQ